MATTEIHPNELEAALAEAERRVEEEVDRLRRRARVEAVCALIEPVLPAGLPVLNWSGIHYPGRGASVHAWPVHGGCFTETEACGVAADFAVWLHGAGDGTYTATDVTGDPVIARTRFDAEVSVAGLAVRLFMTFYHDHVRADRARQIVAEAVETARATTGAVAA